jgi:integrase
MSRGRKPKDPGRTFASLYETFISFKQAEGCRERTIADYRSTLKDFAKFFDVNLLITNPKLYDALIEYFKSKANKQPATYNRPYSNLHAFFEYCVARSYLKSNPLKDLGLKKRRDDDETIRHVDESAIDKLLNAIDKRTYTGLRDYALILLTLDTGIRPKEAFALTLNDVDLEKLTVRVRKEVSKVKKERILPITPITAAVLSELINNTPEEWGDLIFYSTTGLPMTTHMWTKRMEKYSEKIGAKITPYSLRHTFAIMYLRNGGNQFALKYEMGHSTMTMTSRYVKLVQTDVETQHRIASPVYKLVRRRSRGIKRGPAETQ